MEVLVDGVGHGFVDAGGALEVLEAGAFDGAGCAEVHEQGFFAGRADAGDIVQGAGGEGFGAFFAVGADGEPMGFVAQALEIEEDRAVRGQGELAA